ncbi:MAG: hypothetical protein IJP54_08045 [Synergistaceae bacterium]|nr:hypothetical protein [Synergistaceae bacterium]MBR0035614.1 hypothetical protein [Synergistaceae bacterium]
MNYWTQQSIDFAQQRNYLDELFKVYPLSPKSSDSQQNCRYSLSDGD